MTETMREHLSLKVFTLAKNETCSAVTRIDWPTRVNDSHCSHYAVAVCMNAGCKATLCTLHLEQCSICSHEFCAGCLEDHLRTVHKAEL